MHNLPTQPETTEAPAVAPVRVLAARRMPDMKPDVPLRDGELVRFGSEGGMLYGCETHIGTRKFTVVELAGGKPALVEAMIASNLNAMGFLAKRDPVGARREASRNIGRFADEMIRIASEFEVGAHIVMQGRQIYRDRV
jgi:hypothetical protein